MQHMTESTTPKPELFDTVTVSRLFGVDRTTITRWVSDGDLVPAYGRPGKGGYYLFDRAGLEALQAGQLERAEAQLAALKARIEALREWSVVA